MFFGIFWNYWYIIVFSTFCAQIKISFFTDESCAFEIWFYTELWRGSSRVRGNEARICGPVGYQSDHSRGQVALLEFKLYAPPTHLKCVARCIITAFIYRNCYRGPNDVSVNAGQVDWKFWPRARSSKYYPILRWNIFFLHAIPTPFPSRRIAFLGHIQDILRPRGKSFSRFLCQF